MGKVIRSELDGGPEHLQMNQAGEQAFAIKPADQVAGVSSACDLPTAEELTGPLTGYRSVSHDLQERERDVNEL